MTLMTLTSFGVSPPVLSKTETIKSKSTPTTVSDVSLVDLNAYVVTLNTLGTAMLPTKYYEPRLDIYFVIIKSDPKHSNRIINGILNEQSIQARQRDTNTVLT